MARAWSRLVKRRRQVVVAGLAFAAFGVWGVAVRSGLVFGALTWLGLDERAAVIAAVAMTPAADFGAAAAAETATVASITSEPPESRVSPTATYGTVTATPQRVAAVTATATPAPQPTATREPPPTPVPSYARTLTPSPVIERHLRVDQDRQEMLVYEGDELMRTIAVSTGAPYENSFTPAWTGRVGAFWGKAQFRGTDLWADYIWYLFPGATGSILIHSVPYVNNGDEKVYDRPEALGVEPASKGCVRISPEDAEWLARWDPVGVPIEITPYSGVILPAPTAP
jgi:hypothetical protein